MHFSEHSPRKFAVLIMSKGSYVSSIPRAHEPLETTEELTCLITGYFSTQMDKADIPMRSSSEFANILAAPSAAEIDELAERSESLEQRVASLNDSYETLKKREVELTEWRWVLRETGSFFDRVCSRPLFVSRTLFILIHRHIRHTVIPKKSGHPWTVMVTLMVMKPRSCKMLSTVVRTVILKANLSPL
jgi:hypothetical protein